METLNSFLSMLSYLNGFTLHLAELTDPIRQVIKKKVPFMWKHPQVEALTMSRKKLLIFYIEIFQLS